MKLRIKIKNILWILLSTFLIILVILPFLTLQIAKVLHHFGSDKSTVFYESYLSKNVKLNKTEALYKYAVNINEKNERYHMHLNGWQNPHSNITLDDMEKAKLALVEIMTDNPNKKSIKKYRSKAYKELLDSLISMVAKEELLEWIEWGQNDEELDIKYISRIYDYLLNRDYNKVNDILNGFSNWEDILDKDFFNIRGYAAILGEKDKLAEEYYAKVNEEYWYEDYKDLFKGNHKIKGKVSYNGIGIPFARIYVEEATGGFRIGKFGFVGITDINGEYETIGLRPGKYDIGIGLNHTFLYDKVYLKENISLLELEGDMEFNYRFAQPLKIISPNPGTIVEGEKIELNWEAVDNADYYNIQTLSYGNPKKRDLGIYTYSLVNGFNDGKIKENRVEFYIDKLRKYTGIIGYGDNMTPSPGSILGSFIPGIQYPIIINAYDKVGNLVGSSLPQSIYYDELNSITIKGELTKGEELILNQSYEEAIDYYKKSLALDPKQEEALFYLSKFYTLGWGGETADYEKAAEYAKRYFNIGGDLSLLIEVVNNMRYRDKDKNKELIKEILDMVPIEDRGPGYYWNLGLYYQISGEFEKAREAYENIKYNLPIDIFYIDLYLGDFHKAIQRLDSLELIPYRMGSKILIRTIKELSKEHLETQDYKEFKELLKIMLIEKPNSSQGNRLYNEMKNKILDPNINKILDEIKLEEHWNYMEN